MPKKNKLYFFLFDLSSEIFEFKDELINIVQLRIEDRLEDVVDFYGLVSSFIECVVEEPEKIESIRLKDTLYPLCTYADEYYLINETVDHFFKAIEQRKLSIIELHNCDNVLNIQCFTRCPSFVIGIEYERPEETQSRCSRLGRRRT